MNSGRSRKVGAREDGDGEATGQPKEEVGAIPSQQGELNVGSHDQASQGWGGVGIPPERKNRVDVRAFPIAEEKKLGLDKVLAFPDLAERKGNFRIQEEAISFFEADPSGMQESVIERVRDPCLIGSAHEDVGGAVGELADPERGKKGAEMEIGVVAVEDALVESPEISKGC